MKDFRKQQILFYAKFDRKTEQYKPVLVGYVSKLNDSYSYIKTEEGTTFIGETNLLFTDYEECAGVCLMHNHTTKNHSLTVTYKNNELSSYEFDTLKINRETGFITIERKGKYTAGIVIDFVRSVEIKF